MRLRGVMAEIQCGLREATPFFLDSQSAEDLALNPVFHKRSADDGFGSSPRLLLRCSSKVDPHSAFVSISAV